jgi:allantoin racemase
MTTRIAFINPVGVGDYDAQMERTLAPFVSADAAVDVLHFTGVPADIAFYLPKHIIELGLLEMAPVLEAAGYDAIIIGCCYDPGVRIAREVVDIPVIGPMEAAAIAAGYFGHRFSVVTDAPKTGAWIDDLLRVYGVNTCLGIHAIDWQVPDMLADPIAVAEAARGTVERALAADGSDVAVIGCTTIAACIEEAIAEDDRFREVPFVNPSTAALQTAEALGRLHRQGRYRLSRRGYYRRHEQANPAEAAEIRERYHVVDTAATDLALVGQAGVFARRQSPAAVGA